MGWRQWNKSEPVIRVYGNMEVTQVHLSFKMGGKLLKRLVNEGDPVSAGQLIGFLDPKEWEHERDSRIAQAAQALAYLEELQNGYRPEEIAQGKAMVEETLAVFTQQQAEWKRQQALFAEAVISQKELDISQSTYENAQAALKKNQEQYLLLLSGTRQEQIDQAFAQWQSAAQQAALSEVRLQDTKAYSPLNGWVLVNGAEEGEVVAAGTVVVTVANLQDIWFRAYIEESDLGKICLGQKVEVTTDSYPNKSYIGRITFISQEAEFTPKIVQTQKERVKLVYRIKVTLDNPYFELKPGMPAEGVLLYDS